MPEAYHPCRYCTDKPICRGGCVKATPYLQREREAFARRLAAARQVRENGKKAAGM